MRDACRQQATQLRFPLVKVDRVAHQAQVLCCRHAGRPGTDDRHPLTVLGSPLPVDLHAPRPCIVGGESLQRLDRDRVLRPLHPATLAIGLAWMVAKTSEHRRKGIGFVNHEPGIEVSTLRNVVDVGGDVLVDRAGPLARRHRDIEAQVTTPEEDLVGCGVGRGLADLGQHFEGADDADRLRRLLEQRTLILGDQNQRRIFAIHDVGAGLE